MRTKQEIIADPQATEAELIALAETHAALAAQHPNCPLVLWWGLLIDCPLDAMKSPAAPLYLLEDPSTYRDIELSKANDWVNDTLRRNQISRVAAQRLAMFCLDHAIQVVSPRLEARFFDGFSRCMEHRRRLAGGKITAAKYLQLAEIILPPLAGKMWQVSDDDRQLTNRILLALESDDVEGTALFCADAVACMIDREWGSAAWNAAWHEERVWQWNQLLSLWRETP